MKVQYSATFPLLLLWVRNFQTSSSTHIETQCNVNVHLMNHEFLWIMNSHEFRFESKCQKFELISDLEINGSRSNLNLSWCKNILNVRLVPHSHARFTSNDLRGCPAWRGFVSRTFSRTYPWFALQFRYSEKVTEFDSIFHFLLFLENLNFTILIHPVRSYIGRACTQAPSMCIFLNF